VTGTEGRWAPCYYCGEDAIGCIRVGGRGSSEDWRLVAVCTYHAESAGRPLLPLSDLPVRLPTARG